MVGSLPYEGHWGRDFAREGAWPALVWAEGAACVPEEDVVGVSGDRRPAGAVEGTRKHDGSRCQIV